MVRKIPKMPREKEKTWHCSRCGKPLPHPVDKTGVYVYDSKNGIEKLICPQCTEDGDFYIWGHTGVL